MGERIKKSVEDAGALENEAVGPDVDTRAFTAEEIIELGLLITIHDNEAKNDAQS